MDSNDIRERLGRVGWSQARAARTIGISESHLARFLSGERTLGRDAEERLRAALETAEADLAEKERRDALARLAVDFRSAVDAVVGSGR